LGGPTGEALLASSAIRGVVKKVAAKGGFNAFKGYKNALQPFKGGRFTNAGRALTKHPNIVGAKDAAELTKLYGNQTGINKAASDALKNIMRNGTQNVHPTKAFGQVIDYKLPSGLGARFSTTTNEFIGWLGRGL